MPPPDRPPDLVRPLPDPDATDQAGAALGAALRGGDVVLLWGDLGAGKSALARAAINARSGETDIPSPTFTLVQVYEADIAIWHADLYRLSGPEGAEDLGLFDLPGDAAAFIEWPARLGEEAPERRLDISLTERGEGRSMQVWASGSGWEDAMTALSA